MIFTVTGELAFSQSLDETTEDVEFAIVAEAKRLLGPRGEVAGEGSGLGAIAEALQTGHPRVANHMPGMRPPKLPPSKIDPSDVIFRVRTARVFAQPLQATIEDVERAIVLVAYVKFEGNKRSVCEALGAGRARIDDHFANAKEELRAAGWLR